MDITTALLIWYSLGWAAAALDYVIKKDAVDIGYAFVLLLLGPIALVGVVIPVAQKRVGTPQQYWWRKPSEKEEL